MIGVTRWQSSLEERDGKRVQRWCKHNYKIPEQIGKAKNMESGYAGRAQNAMGRTNKRSHWSRVYSVESDVEIRNI